MGAGTGYFLQLATGSPRGLDTTRGVPGDRPMSPRTPAAPSETVSLRWGRHVPRSHLVISPLLAHLHGGVLTTSRVPLDSPVRKCILVLALCSLLSALALIPGASGNVPGTTPQGRHGPGPLLASQPPPPPVSLPQGSLCRPWSQDRLFMGWEGDLPWVHLCPLQLCALCPRETLQWSASCGKEPRPGNSWSDGLNLRRGSPVARVSSHPPACPLCNPSSLFCPLPLPPWVPETIPTHYNPWACLKFPSGAPKAETRQEHMGLRSTQRQALSTCQVQSGQGSLERSPGATQSPWFFQGSQTSLLTLASPLFLLLFFGCWFFLIPYFLYAC